MKKTSLVLLAALTFTSCGMVNRVTGNSNASKVSASQGDEFSILRLRIMERMANGGKEGQ